MKETFSNLTQKPADRISTNDTTNYIFGLDSSFPKIFKEKLSLSDETYLRFMSTITIQSSLALTPSQLFCEEDSILAPSIPMTQDEYVEIWKEIAVKDRMATDSYIGDGRRVEYLYEKLERDFNLLCWDILIACWQGSIGVALDNDKT